MISSLNKSVILNVNEYYAKSISLSGGFNSGKSDSKGEKQPATVASSPSRTDQHASSITGVSKSIGFGLDSENDSSVTKSGINTSNITIRETVRQQELTGKSAEQIKSEILTDVTTDTARENSGALNNNFDRNKVKSEINLQVDVTQAFDANRQEVKAEINKKLDEAKKENQSILDKEKQGQFLTSQEQDQLKVYNDKVEKYQNLGVLLDTISTGLSAPTSSGLGIATATLSPVASYEIGQYFKSKDAEGSTAHILAHTVLGAAVAAAGGNDALIAGLSAGGAEAAAPLLSKYLYGKDAQDLTADEKGTVSAITGLVASGVGASTGDVASSVQSGQSAQNAVENNTLYQEYAILASKGKTREQEAEELVTGADEFYRKNNCAGLSATACNTKMYAERKEVLWLATGFLPVIGDIQTLAQAKSAGDVLWAMVGIVPGLGEARQAYKVAEKAGDLAGMKKALEQGTAIATQKGYVNKTKVTVNQTALKITSKADQDLVNRIAKGEDKGGELTEQLFNSLAKQNGFTVIKGGKYGSNNGFDHVWVAKDGSVTILSDSKQITNGTVKLAPNAAGGNTQLSKAWIDAVIDNLAPNDPTRQILINADKAGKLKTAVTGVDRATGQAVIIPVNVPAKSKPTVKK